MLLGLTSTPPPEGEKTTNAEQSQGGWFGDGGEAEAADHAGQFVGAEDDVSDVSGVIASGVCVGSKIGTRGGAV